MGRGRAKAKQTKVARELKYHTPNTDLTALQRELSSEEPGAWLAAPSSEASDEDDAYTDDDEESWAPKAG
jgi:hypothetical protein